MKFVLVGAGQRGMIYATYAHEEKGMEIAAVVEINEERRQIAVDKLEIPHAFDNLDDMLAAGIDADAAILATMDQDHYGQAMKLLDAGYNILLEKPISPSAKECIEIQQKADALGKVVVVCHVLRYTNFFSSIKDIIDSGELGKVMTIQHAENVGNFHMAHSFVRGNWRNSDSSSPIIMQKSCHDLDILVWLTGSRAEKISSFGNLRYFKEENAPEGSTERCLDCPVAESCRFDVRKAYLPARGGWPASVVCSDQSEEGLLKAFETSPYGRCVYRSDNNVCDSQVTTIEFENGVTATFHLSGFSNHIHRTIKVMCEHGDIYGDDDTQILKVTKYQPNQVGNHTVETIHLGSANGGPTGGHGGGDYGLMDDFLALASTGGIGDSRSSISRSVESHLMACAAEEARLNNKVVIMDEYRKELSE